MSQSVNQWMGAAYIFSALAGALVRHNSTAALSAMGGMLNGMAEGRDDAIKMNFQQWDRENKRALELNEQKLKEYELAVADRSRPIVQAQEALKFIAAKWQDPLMMEANSFETQMSLMDRQRDSQTSAISTATKIVDLKNKIEAHATSLKFEALEAAAQRYRQTGTLPPNTGKNFQGGVNSAEIQQRAAEQEIAAGGNTADWPQRWQQFRANQAASTLRARAEPAAIAAALTQQEKSKAAVQGFENTAVMNGKVLIDLAKKIDTTGIPVMERWIRAGKQATGDPDVAAFHAQMGAYRAEVAKIITNPNMTGVLTDTARKEVEEFLPNPSSIGQIERVVGLFEQDFKRREYSIDQQIFRLRNELKSGTPNTAPIAPTGAYAAPEQKKLIQQGDWLYDPDTKQPIRKAQ